MMRKNSASLILIALLLVIGCFACTTSSDPLITDGDTADGDDVVDGDNDAADAADGDDVDDVVDGDTVAPACEDFEDGCCTIDANCLQGKCYDGVCVITPSKEVEVWWENSEYDPDEGQGGGKVGQYDKIFDENDPAKPDLSCSGDLADELDAGTVSVRAKVKVFGVKAPCTSLKVELFTQYDDNGTLRTEFTSDVIISSASVQDLPDENYECWLDIENVPAARWLVMKIFDDGNILFKDTYQFNVYIKKEEVGKAEPFFLEVNSISNTSWSLVPLTAGVTNGIQSGRGVISGSAKDCKGRLLSNVTLGASVVATKIAYFNADVSDLLPNPSFSMTNIDGTYAFINVPGHPLTVKTMILLDGEVKVMHSFEVVIIGGAVSIYGTHGAGPSNYGYFEGVEE